MAEQQPLDALQGAFLASHAATQALAPPWRQAMVAHALAPPWREERPPRAISVREEGTVPAREHAVARDVVGEVAKDGPAQEADEEWDEMLHSKIARRARRLSDLATPPQFCWLHV